MIGIALLTFFVNLFSIILEQSTPAPNHLEAVVNNSEYLAYDLGISQEDIELNPSGKNPLSAQITFETRIKGQVQIIIKAKDENCNDLQYSVSGYNEKHSIPILGLYEDFNNQVEIMLTDPKGKIKSSQTVEIKTDTIGNAVRLDVIQNEIPEFLPKYILIGNTIYDASGNLRWISKFTGQHIYKLSGNKFGVRNTPKEFLVTDIENMVHQKYSVPTKVHHEIFEIEPGGNIVVGSNNSDSLKTEDYIIEFDRQTKEVARTWDMRDYFDQHRKQIRDFKEKSDWCHMNSIVYDKNDNTFLISSKHQSFVAKIGYDDGQVKWILGNHNHWKPRFKKYLLTPENFDTSNHVDQDWTYHQHTASVMPNGDILVYDNGADRPGFPKDSIGNPDGGYARVVRYRVDEEKMTVRKVWQYTDYPNRGSISRGGVFLLANDYMLIGYSNFDKVVIINSKTGAKVFEGNTTKGSDFYRANAIDFEEYLSSL